MLSHICDDPSMIQPGAILRQSRRRRGLSQGQLAIRAGTTQSVISRLENGHVSPSIETFDRLMGLLGEQMELTSSEVDVGVDRGLLRANLELTPLERLRGATRLAVATCRLRDGLRE